MAMSFYERGMKMLSVLAELEDDFKHNYEKGNIQERALANVAGLQCDLFASYIVLLGEDEKGPLVGRAVILRSILENHGAMLHIKGSDKRSEKYLGHVEKIQQQVKDNLEGRKTAEKDFKWSTSTITHRVGLVDDSAPRLYDMLSNFTHGNNIQYFFDTKELTEAFTKASNSYYISLFIGFLAELGIGLDMKKEKRELVFGVLDEVGKHESKAPQV